MLNSNNGLFVVLAIVGVALLAYVFYFSDNSSMPATTMAMVAPTATVGMPATTVEKFTNPAPADQVQMSSMQRERFVDASEDIQYVEQPQGLSDTGSGVSPSALPSECYPKDVLSSADLLPRDANSLYAQVNPSGQGSLADQNFLTAGFHIGINTVGQTLRNANRQLRSEPPNPQTKVSPWLQSTIEPDINRLPLEIGSGAL